MSRSIHETRKMLAEIMKYDFSTDWRSHHEKRMIENRLRKKRSIKSHVTLDRSNVDPSISPTPLDQIPIVVRDEGHFVHYPASPEDVCALMHRLPPGSCDKLHRIELTLDRFEDEYDSSNDSAVDPYIGRFSVQDYPGVYSSGVYGDYDKNTMNMHLYGYVYGPDLPHRDKMGFLLKCRVLSTFVHEIAHHQDRTTRMARGRWRMDMERKDEKYACGQQDEWDFDYVIPYVEETYPAEVNRLLDWLEKETGIRLTLSMIFGGRNEDVGWFLELDPIFKSIAANDEKYEIRRKLIIELFWAGPYEKALEEIDRFLPEHPSDHELITLKARILRDQKQFSAAREVFRQALAIAPQYMDAWKFLVYLDDDERNWPEAIKDAEHAIGLYQQQNELGPFVIYMCRVIAMMELGDLDGAETAINETEALFSQVKSERIRVNALIGVDKMRKELRKKRGEPNKK